jgi:hypothetical protein
MIGWNLTRREQAMGEQTDVTGLDEAVVFQRDLYLYWREAHAADGIAITTRGYVSRPALRRIRTLLARARADSVRSVQSGAEAADRAEGEDLRLFYLRRLLERLGLLRAALDGSQLVATGRGEITRYFAHSLAERLRICARLWVAGGWWPDQADPAAVPQRLLAPAPPRIALARRRTLETLAIRSPGDHVAIPPPPLGQAKVMRSRGRRQELGKLAHPTGTDGESETLRAALLGPLAWMGFVALEDVGKGEHGADDGEATWCRTGITLQALAPGADTSQIVERAGRVVVQPDSSVVAYPPLTAPLLLTLDTCAEALSLDVVARYRVSRAALARASQVGWSAAEIIRRLEALSGVALPANVRASLADWERHVARLRLTPTVSVLEVRTAQLMDALLAERATREWVERRLTPTAALLVPERVPQARGWLLRHGEVPALLRAGAATPGGSDKGADMIHRDAP